MTLVRQPSRTEKVLDSVLPARPREKQLELEMAAVNEVLGRIEGDNFRLDEALRNVELMIDEKGWTSIFDFDGDEAPTLAMVKSASKQLREMVVANPIIRRGANTRGIYVWGGGVDFSGRNRTGKGEAKPLTAELQALMETTANQRYVFSNDAHEEFERTAFTEGNLFLLGNDETKRLQRIPIWEITADLRNPDNSEEIWAFRRQWDQRPNAADGDRKTMVRWYFTDIYEGTRPGSITHVGKREKVERGYTILDKTFNRQIGWAYGVPDGLAVLAWAKLYREFLVNGHVMSRALARFAYKVTTNSTKGGTNAALEISKPGQAGSTHVEGAGQNLQPLLSAGKGYDFESGKPILSVIAAGLEVGLSVLTGEANGSSESLLDATTRLTAAMRRKSWEDYWLRLFRWMGLTKKLVVTWNDLPEGTIQRILQAWTLLHNSGLFGPEKLQAGMADVMNIADPGPIPSDYVSPNARGGAQGANTSGNAGATAGSGQGQNSPAGKSQDDHDDDAEA